MLPENVVDRAPRVLFICSKGDYVIKVQNMRKRHTQKVQVVSSKLADASADVPDLRFRPLYSPRATRSLPRGKYQRPGLP